MKYISLKINSGVRRKPRFDHYYINSSRRDLIKQLVTVGVLGATSLIGSPFSFALGNRSSSVNPIWRTHEGYEDLRNALTWKPNIPARYPDVIVHAKSEEQIIQALAFAEEHDLQVVTRSSGHNIDTLRDGGMLLDISTMTDFSIDVDGMQASVQPGLISYYFYEQLAQKDLIFPVADCHTVALGGYLLGGGYSCMGYYWGGGPACYSIIAADVILADGRKVTASREKNAELFWTIRGVGPGFFGVVTRFQLQLYRQPKVFMQSSYDYPLEALAAVLKHLDNLKDIKSNQTLVAVVLQKQPGPSNLLKAKLLVRALGESESEVSDLLAPYSEIEAAEVISKKEYERSNYRDFMYNPGRSERNLSDNIWTQDRSVVTGIIEHCKDLPEQSVFITTLYSDRQLLVPRNDACHSASGRHFMSNHLLWDDAGRDAENEQWYVKLITILQGYASSYYVNQMEGQNRKERMKACFSKENWQRLSGLRHKYDPDERFCTHVGWS